MRRRIHEILTTPRADDVLGRTINFALLLLIAANVVSSVIETDAGIRRQAPEFFYVFERVSVAVFTVEYLVRLWACTADPRFRRPFAGRLRMAMRPMALVDLFAIAPFYVELLYPGTLDLRFLRVLRLLRVFRLLRIRRVADAFGAITRVIASKRVELGITLAVVIVAMLLAAGAIFAAERAEPGTTFTSIPRAMWWSIVTITTIGYGDMVPVTAIGKVIGGFVGFVGICAIALPVGILSSGFVEEINRHNAAPAANAAEDDGACPHCGRPRAP
jgi:voltage-gated potassium channel